MTSVQKLTEYLRKLHEVRPMHRDRIWVEEVARTLSLFPVPYYEILTEIQESQERSES